VDSKGRKALLSFSWIANGKKILSTKEVKGSLGCLHGIRFISMSWVVLGHTYALGAGNSFSNVGSMMKQVLYRFTVNTTICMEYIEEAPRPESTK
jgi:hypothetical protein